MEGRDVEACGGSMYKKEEECRRKILSILKENGRDKGWLRRLQKRREEGEQGKGAPPHCTTPGLFLDGVGLLRQPTPKRALKHVTR